MNSGGILHDQGNEYDRGDKAGKILLKSLNEVGCREAASFIYRIVGAIAALMRLIRVQILRSISRFLGMKANHRI